MKFVSSQKLGERPEIVLGKRIYFKVNLELEITLASKQEFKELPVHEFASLYPFSFIIQLKEKEDTLQFECKVSKNFKLAYGKYAHLELMLIFLKLWLRT